MISDSDAASAASGASKPSVGRRGADDLGDGRAPVSSGATAISPCGASVALNIATTIATAAGPSRRAPIARSTSTR